MSVVITAKLSLAVRLLDTTTGKVVSDTGIRFKIDNNLYSPMRKGEGLFIFVNIGKEDFLMLIDVDGYDKYELEVKESELDQRFPMIDIFLMPSEKNRIGGEILKVFGTLSELKQIEAIDTNRPIALFQSKMEKKNVYKINLLPMTNAGGVKLDTISYAICDETSGRYETITVKEQDSPKSVILEGALQNEHKLNDKLYRIIYGRAGPDGRFCLKVRDDSSNLNFLIRFLVGEKEYYRKLDFHLETGEVNLMQGALEVDSRKDDDTNE